MLIATQITPFRTFFAKQTYGLVLDCGSGTGEYHPFLGGQRIVSLDITSEQLKSVEGEKVCADAARLPFKDNTFDCIWSCGALQYFRVDIAEVIAEWKRVTKHSGKIYILTPNRDSPFDRVKKRLGMRGWKDLGPVERLYSPSELERFGKVYGEVRFLPFLDRLWKNKPSWAHTLMLEITVSKEQRS